METLGRLRILNHRTKPLTEKLHKMYHASKTPKERLEVQSQLNKVYKKFHEMRSVILDGYGYKREDEA
jgi:hypothetical protein